MKKIILILLLLLGFTSANSFPSFPMSIYGDIKVGNIPMSAGVVRIYDGFNREISTYIISQSGKYGARTATGKVLSLNQFLGKITIKVIYKLKTYTIKNNQINDTNRGLGCPSKSSINFVSKNCKYDITL